MGLKLIDKNEKFVYYVDNDVKIFYRRLPMIEKKAITSRHTEKGITDFVAAGIDMLKTAILDWDGITEPCTPENVERLPEDITTGIIELLNAKNGEIDEKK